jgi:drug/metabolite transporter (DMT)-like permease
LATILGAGAILLWATLATLTVLTGVIPPLQTTAITFAIGGSVVALAALARGRGRLMRPTRASLALGVYGLFGYHTLYFAALRLAPPAEAQLICSLWALFIVLFSGLLPGNRLRGDHVLGALLGLLAASLLVWPKLGAGTTDARSMIGFSLAFGCALVWSSYSVASRLLAAVPSESIAVSCLATSALARSSAADCSSSGFGLTV